MKKFLLTLCVLLCCMGASRAQVEYPDVPLDDPAYADIYVLFPGAGQSSGLLERRAMTRYEFAVALARFMSPSFLTEKSRQPFPLMSSQQSEALQRLIKEFAPELRALGVRDLPEKFQSTLSAAPQPSEAPPSQAPKPQHKNIAPPFSDVPKNHWALGAVEKLRQSGIVIGYPNLSSSGARETFLK